MKLQMNILLSVTVGNSSIVIINSVGKKKRLVKSINSTLKTRKDIESPVIV